MRQFKTFQHYKGGLYTKLCEALHTETEETLIVYVCAVSGQTFCRPKAMFEETVCEGSYVGPRFIPLPDGTARDERKKIVWFGTTRKEEEEAECA